MTVGANGVHVEGVCDAELAGAEVQPPDGQFGGKRQRAAGVRSRFVAKRHDLMDHGRRQIGYTAELWVTDYVQVGEAGQTQRLADAMSRGALDIHQKLSGAGGLKT